VCGEGGMCVCVCVCAVTKNLVRGNHFWLPKIVDPETGRYWSVRTKVVLKVTSVKRTTKMPPNR